MAKRSWIARWRVGYTLDAAVSFIQGLLSDGSELPSLGRREDADEVVEVALPEGAAVFGR